MKPDDLKKAPKLFCETINIGFSPEYFIVALSSGSQASIYSLTPQHIQRLHEYLGTQIKEYEKKHGVIPASTPKAVVSPVQRTNPPSALS